LQRGSLSSNVTSVQELREQIASLGDHTVFVLDVQELILEQPIILSVPNITLRGRGMYQTKIGCLEGGQHSALDIR